MFHLTSFELGPETFPTCFIAFFAAGNHFMIEKGLVTPFLSPQAEQQAEPIFVECLPTSSETTTETPRAAPAQPYCYARETVLKQLDNYCLRNKGQHVLHISYYDNILRISSANAKRHHDGV
jgi:hypothetical protein